MAAVTTKSTLHMAHGIKPDHAFSIISATVVEDSAGFISKLIKLRDPYGKIKWTGEWS